ncbi:reverse transcriptase domain-containing protein [Tanacetum coccineum]
MVTPAEKRSSNKFCEFHNDKGHNTDECVQLKKQIEELVRAGKLSHFIKEIRQDKHQQKTGKKDAPAKDKATTIYMIQSWQRVTRQKVTQSFDRVKEITFPPLTVSKGTEGPLVIEAEIGGHAVHRMYVDGGSSMEWRNYMAARTAKALGDYRRRKALYESMDELYDSEVAVTVQWYHWTAGDKRDPSATPKDTEKKAETRHENFKVAIHPDFTDQEIAIGGALSAKGRTKLCALLKANLDIFAWQPSDMTGVPRSIAEHRLNIRDGYPPVRQKKRSQAPERAKAIQAEVQKSVEAGIMIVILSQRLIGRSNPYAAILLSVFLGRNYKGTINIQWSEADGRKDDFPYPLGGISELPYCLVAPRPKEELIMYLSASHEAVGVVLMTKRDTIQTPVYFLSRALQGAELNYTLMEKLILALVCAAKRLRRYFQAHHVVVITYQPIKQIISRPDVAGRLQKWSIMLGEHNITYRPRTSVKGQILADFLVEKPDEVPANTSVKEVPQEPWTLFTDGSSCVDGSGAGLILTSPEGTEFTYALRFQFAASNNEAEYEALIAGLRIAAQMGVRNVQVSVDSKLVANQVLGTYIAKEDNMIKYLEKTKSLVGGFDSFSISQVPRSKNKKADALSKIASTSFAHLSKQVLVEILKEKSIQEKEVAAVASKLRIKARQYELWEGILYRRSFLKPWLRCVGPLQADYVIREIHEGSCSMHAGPRSVVAKAMRSGYYWPTMHRDARDMIRKCKDCQVHRPVPRHPQQPLTPITAPWPFYKWGIDIAGPFPEGPGKVKFLIVAMDYFTKWIEAKAVATISGTQVKKFVWDNIVCRFGLPGEIVSDNSKYFSGDPFKDCLGEGIKTRLGEGNRNWLEELPHVLWAHRTMFKSSNDDTPFSLTYGTKSVIPAEIGMPTYRTAVVDFMHNDEELRLNLDLLEERRERATIREAKAKLNMKKYYNARVRGVTFRLGDLVYRSNDAIHAVDGGKLGPKWEGPYEVMESLGDGAYKLRSTDGIVLPRT